jgi:hypothetical protein
MERKTNVKKVKSGASPIEKASVRSLRTLVVTVYATTKAS